MDKFSQVGLIMASQSMHSTIKKDVPKAYKVTSWQNDRSPKTQATLNNILRAGGHYSESVFDAAHGRRYLLFIYRTPQERKACWDVLTGDKAA